MDAFMARQTIVSAFVQTALYAEKVTRATLRPAKLDPGS